MLQEATRTEPGPLYPLDTMRSMAPKSAIPLWPGKPFPLGAKVTSEGTNFALFSENATGVELCLFERREDVQESARIRLSEITDAVWHCFLPNIGSGQLYGYRV